MRFLDCADEMRRLDALLAHPGAFAVIWGRRRVGKTRLLIEWSQRHDGLYAAADPSAPAVQRRYEDALRDLVLKPLWPAIDESDRGQD